MPDRRVPGVAPANFAFHAAHLGADAAVVSAVGHDQNGTDLLDWCRTVGFNFEYLQQNDLPTGSVSVRVDDHGQPQYEIHTDVAWDSIRWNRSLESLAGRADCVCVGSLSQRSDVSRPTVRRFLAATRPACLRIFDLNLREPHFSRDVIDQTSTGHLRRSTRWSPDDHGTFGPEDGIVIPPTAAAHSRRLRWRKLIAVRSADLV